MTLGDIKRNVDKNGRYGFPYIAAHDCVQKFGEDDDFKIMHASLCEAWALVRMMQAQLQEKQNGI